MEACAVVNLAPTRRRKYPNIKLLMEWWQEDRKGKDYGTEFTTDPLYWDPEDLEFIRGAATPGGGFMVVDDLEPRLRFGNRKMFVDPHTGLKQLFEILKKWRRSLLPQFDELCFDIVVMSGRLPK